MKRLWVVTLMFATGLAFAQDAAKVPLKSPIKGYLVDMLCVRQRKSEGVKLGPAHTKMCLRMPNCVQSGYAVMTPDYQILKFDKSGTDKAMRMLEKSSQDKGFWVSVSGKIEGDEIKVSKIELLKAPASD